LNGYNQITDKYLIHLIELKTLSIYKNPIHGDLFKCLNNDGVEINLVIKSNGPSRIDSMLKKVNSPNNNNWLK
jgi:hypothetical protein